MINMIKTKLAENSVTIGITLIVWLIMQILKELLPLVLPSILQNSPPKLILLLLVLSMLGNLTLLTLVLLNRNKKLKLKFGIYWDKEAEPYCPICKTPLQTGEHAFTYINGVNYGSANLTCPKCDKSFLMRDDSSKITHLKTAKKSILGKKYNF